MKLGDVRKDLTEASKTYKPRQKRWTIEEEKIMRDFYGKVPTQLLGQKLGRSVASIQHRAILLGV
jgi:hypothetical protein